MSKKYVIRWKSKVNGRAGRGTKEFSLEEAQRLSTELNGEYPDIEHEPIPAPPPESKASETEANPAGESHPPNPVHAFSS